MNPLHNPGLQSCVGADALSGCWKLGDGRALTLRPTQPGVLRMAHGRVWVTFDNARQDDGARGGDHFLEAGEVLQLLPGQALVMESWNGATDAAAYFSWDPLPATAGIARWRGGVAQPLRDLRLALGLAGTALGRLVVGLAGVSAAAVRALAPRFRY